MCALDAIAPYRPGAAVRAPDYNHGLMTVATLTGWPLRQHVVAFFLPWAAARRGNLSGAGANSARDHQQGSLRQRLRQIRLTRRRAGLSFGSAVLMRLVKEGANGFFGRRSASPIASVFCAICAITDVRPVTAKPQV